MNNTTVIDGTHIETKSQNGPKTVYQLSEQQPFVNSTGYSSNDYGEFFISCAVFPSITLRPLKCLLIIFFLALGCIAIITSTPVALVNWSK